MSNQIQFNGVAIVAPIVFEVNLRDLDSDKTNRNANGYMIRDRLRGAMRALHFEWGPLDSSDIKTILQAVSPAGISVYYPDPMDGGWETRTVYVGDRVTKALYDFDSGKWTGLAFDLTEY